MNRTARIEHDALYARIPTNELSYPSHLNGLRRAFTVIEYEKVSIGVPRKVNDVIGLVEERAAEVMNCGCRQIVNIDALSTPSQL